MTAQKHIAAAMLTVGMLCLTAFPSFAESTLVAIGVPPSADAPNVAVSESIGPDGTTCELFSINDEIVTEVEAQAAEIHETPTYTEDDLYFLEHVICGETQTGSWEDQLYVGSVVLNRCADPDFPSTIAEVIKDKKYGIQYACYYDGNFFRTPTDTNRAAALYLLEHGSQAPSNVIYQSRAKQGSGVWKKEGEHYYCYK